MKGALSGEFVEMFYKKSDVLQSQSRINVCAYNIMYVHAGVCVHVYMYGSEVSPLYCNHSRQRDPSCLHD